MPQTRLLSRSFAAGLISPEVHGRIDLGKFQTGLQECKNFIVLPQGPVQNRTGLQYVNESKFSDKRSVLLPFSYNNDQTYAIEIGDGYAWFHTAGATLLETAKTITAITSAAPGVFTSVAHGFTNGRVVYLSGITGMTALNGKYYRVASVTANTFQLLTMANVAVDTNALPAFGGAGNAAMVVELTVPYVQAHLPRLHWAQSADVLTVVHPEYPPAEFRRLSATSWSYTVIDFDPPVISGNFGGSVIAYRPTDADPPPSGSQLHQYKVTIVDADGWESETGLPLTERVPPGVTSSFPTAPEIEIDTITLANPGVITTAAAHGRLPDEPIVIRPNPLCGMPEIANRELFVDTTPTATTLTLKDEFGVPVDTTTYTAYNGAAGGLLAGPHALMLAGVYNDLTEDGFYNQISVTLQTGFTGRVYKSFGGFYGFLGETANGFVRDYDITPASGITPPNYDTPFTGADNYPRAVTYFEQRRWFGGTDNNRQRLWATRSGTESDMTFHVPTQDDDRIDIRLAARQANTIEHLIAIDELVALTQDSEWKIVSATGEAIVPSSISAKPQSYVGASRIQPVATNASVLYASGRSDSIRELSFSFDSNKYESRDLTLLTPSLFHGHNFTGGMSYQRDPVQTLWVVRDDGVLLGLTYVPEQDIRAWHRHETDGVIESVCCIADGRDDAVYVIVKRTINAVEKRYVERFHPREFATIADCFYVDCGLTYDGVETDTITGLGHLEGETVSVLADGAVQGQKVVTNGQITLDLEASKVHVGLPYDSDLETLPMYLEMEAFGQSNVKNVNSISVRLLESSSLDAGPSFDKLLPIKTRTVEPFGSPPSLVSGRYRSVLTGLWDTDGTVCMRQSNPLPVTITQLVIEVAVGG